MTDTLRDRIKEEVLDGILSMLSEGDSVEMAAGYIADAVIRALDLGIPCAATGCRMRQIARRASTAK